MKRLRKFGSVFLVLALCLPLLPTVSMAAESGTIEISSAEELKEIGSGSAGYPLDGNYILTAGIDLENTPWTPIGTQYPCFTGTFDGQGHAISGL